jgi:hypothetical protein
MLAATLPRQPDSGRLLLTSSGDVETAARALARGAIVGHGFANFYALTTRPDAEIVRAVNVLKGRPQAQVGSVTTTPVRVLDLWDLDRLPDGLSTSDVQGLLDALCCLGPVGFRGPAAELVPGHLTQFDGMTTAQVILPGYACPSNVFLASAIRRAGTPFLYITSANRSRHQTGAADEPAHFRASGLRAEFGANSRFLLLEHVDEAAARQRYPGFQPMSTSILALHKLAPGRAGRRTLVLERHGSLPVDRVREAVAPLGFDVVLGPGAARRLQLRRYPELRAVSRS